MEEFSKLKDILKTQNNEQLLWILQRYFQKIFEDKISDIRNPYLYYYELGLRKQIPSSKFSEALLITNQYNKKNITDNYFDTYIYDETLKILKQRIS